MILVEEILGGGKHGGLLLSEGCQLRVQEEEGSKRLWEHRTGRGVPEEGPVAQEMDGSFKRSKTAGESSVVRAPLENFQVCGAAWDG